ncbi:MAG: FHA domain-containing protein [Betaproteobacteria bacterium]|nr:FHA domain-containing protein [Betaproteobacteria bacterium]MCL2162318.1 FHA domain-containing protein [Betaproteobacteria bacterium]
MPDSRHLCVLVAEIVGGDRLVTRLGEAETGRAVDRCLNRVDLAIGGSGGEIIARDRSAIIAAFEQCDSAVMAACEAIDRVRKLPPVTGTQMLLRIGLHFGEVENGMGEGVEGARRILQACDIDQSMVSATVVDQLSPAVRKFASAEAFLDAALEKLPWPVFMIGAQGTTTASPMLSLRPRQRPEPSSPLTSSRPLPATPPPAPSSPAAAQSSSGPRMRLKHQQDILFVDENRPVVLLGRELGNDVVIIDPRASRQHARIELRREGFILTDESTNGCFVSIEGQEEQCLKGTALPLTGSGCFGCGFSSKEFENDLVFFELA